MRGVLGKYMKTGKLFITPYGDEVRIVRTNSFEKAKEYLLKNQPKHYSNNVDTLKDLYDNKGSCFYSMEDLHFVFFLEKPKSVFDLSVIVHECVHLANNILSRRGLYLKSDSEEAYTYLIQHLFYEITTFLGFKLK